MDHTPNPPNRPASNTPYMQRGPQQRGQVQNVAAHGPYSRNLSQARPRHARTRTTTKPPLGSSQVIDLTTDKPDIITSIMRVLATFDADNFDMATLEGYVKRYGEDSLEPMREVDVPTQNPNTTDASYIFHQLLREV